MIVNNPVTEARVRYLLIHNKTIRANIQKEKKISIQPESRDDVIESLVAPAQVYNRDKVQTDGGEKLTGLIGRVNREMYQDKTDISMREFIINAQEREIEHLDCAVFQLHNYSPPLEAVILFRFYDCLNIRETQKALQKEPYKIFCVDRTLRRMTREAIERITQIFNEHYAQSAASEYNDMAAKIATRRFME